MTDDARWILPNDSAQLHRATHLCRSLRKSADMTKGLDSLPSFQDPPVDEVAIALQFAEITPFAVLYGAFYELVKDRLPEIEEHDPIDAKFETFSGKLENAPAFSLVERVPPRRVWLVAADKHRLVQLQPDRVVQNWRKMRGKGTYPRFGDVLKDLWENFAALQKVLVATGGQAIAINQCEVSYFNNISLKENETYPQAFERVFSWPALRRFQSPLEGHTLEPEASAFTLGFRVIDSNGGEPRARLVATAQPAMHETGARVIRLTLTFRGPPPVADLGSVNKFLLLGREAIVKTFTDITSEQCHALWKRES